MDRYAWKQQLKRDQVRKVAIIQRAGMVTAGCALGYNYWFASGRVFLHIEKYESMSRLDNLIILEATMYAVQKMDSGLPVDGPINPTRYNALARWFETARRTEVPALVEDKAKQILDDWWPIFEFVYESIEAGKDASNFAIRRLALKKQLSTFEQQTDSR